MAQTRKQLQAIVRQQQDQLASYNHNTRKELNKRVQIAEAARERIEAAALVERNNLMGRIAQLQLRVGELESFLPESSGAAEAAEAEAHEEALTH